VIAEELPGAQVEYNHARVGAVKRAWISREGLMAEMTVHRPDLVNFIFYLLFDVTLDTGVVCLCPPRHDVGPIH
jgi:hypothetical protein